MPPTHLAGDGRSLKQEEERKKQEEEKKEKAERKFEQPVNWLLGRQMLASFKSMIIYSVVGSKLDARDWMHASEYPSDVQKEAEKLWQKQADKSWKGEGEEFWRQRGEFWFDYLSDTGDGMTATYSLAYLCACDLWAEGSLAGLQGTLADPRPGVGFVARPGARFRPSDAYPNAGLNCAESGLDRSRRTPLPRGEFLLVGGDTTYHLSDYESLHVRFQTPFTWAYEDAQADGRLLRNTRRPLFGIPGNHDYYDLLDGFRRQFRAPIRKDKDLGKNDDELEKAPQLAIPGFVRRQESSYVALRLPFGWQFWGLDTELGKIDTRQRKFFRNIKVRDDGAIEQGAKPAKLIVATCAPTTVFGKYADRDDEKSAKAFYQLGLPRPFINPADEDDRDRENTLDRGQCRLDLSGDVHLYARYWGRENGPDPRGNGAPRPARGHYASVVSGIGGAFHHPTTTDAGEICEQALYPPPGESRAAVARHIFNPWHIFWGGNVGAIGFVLTFIIYYATTATGGTISRAFNGFPQTTSPHYLVGAALPIISLAFLALAVWLAARHYAEYEEYEEVRQKATPPTGEATPPTGEEGPEESTKKYERLMGRFGRRVYPAAGLSAVALAGALFVLATYKGTKESDWPFGNSLLVLFTLVWAAGATYLSVNYGDWLSAMASKIKIKLRYFVFARLLYAAAALGVLAGFAVFGRGSYAADIITDILVTLIVVGLLVGLPGVGYAKFGAVMSAGKRKAYRAAGLVFGLFHALLQLAVPILLVRGGSAWAWLAAAVMVLLAMVCGRRLLTEDRFYKLVPAAWLLYGTLMLMLPYAALKFEKGASWWRVFGALYERDGSAARGIWDDLLLCAVAGAVGLVLSCVWLGWYFATALVCHGHNNEAGGAARIERFKQFIRFRLTENDLTGFVIAVDEPKKRGRELEPRLVDVIYLTPLE